MEAEARALLRRKIRSFGWFPGLDEAERVRRIEADVDLYWHLVVAEAEAALVARQSNPAAAEPMLKTVRPEAA